MMFKGFQVWGIGTRGSVDTKSLPSGVALTDIILQKWLSHTAMHQNHPAGLLRHGLPGLTPGVSDLVGVGWS